MATFRKGERVTHLNQNMRTNGLIIDVHSDAGREYFTLRLDNGREVQTIAARLRKGEYTGVGLWQRVLDPSTKCYFFFDEARNETLWDTPEAQARIFGNGEFAEDVEGSTEDGEDLQQSNEPSTLMREPHLITIEHSFRHGLPREDEEFAESAIGNNRQNYVTAPKPSALVDRYSEGLEDEIEPGQFQSSFSSQPRYEPETVRFQNPSQPRYEPYSGRSDSLSQPHNETEPDRFPSSFSRQPRYGVESGRFSGSFQSQPRHEPQSEPQVTLQPTSESYSRSLAIARSTELRHALIVTGEDSLRRNLKVLGISVQDDEYDPHKLTGMLVSALSKIALTMSAQDLSLLLKHVVGRPEEHQLVDKLCSTSSFSARETAAASTVPIRNIILPRSPERAAPPVNADRYGQQELYDEGMRSTPRHGDVSSPTAETQRWSREGSGAMELKGVAVSRTHSPPAPSPVERRPVSMDNRSSLARDFPEEAPQRAYQSFNERRRSPDYDDGYGDSTRPRYEPHYRDAQPSAYSMSSSLRSPPYESRAYVRAEPVSNMLHQKRRDNLWAGVPPPSRLPPSGPSPPKQSPLRGNEASDYRSPVRSTGRSVNSTTSAAGTSSSMSPSRPAFASADSFLPVVVPMNEYYSGDDYALPPIPSTSSSSFRGNSTRTPVREGSPTEVIVNLDDSNVNRYQQTTGSSTRNELSTRTTSPVRNDSPRKLQSMQGSSVKFDDSMNEIYEHREYSARSDASSIDHEALEDQVTGTVYMKKEMQQGETLPNGGDGSEMVEDTEAIADVKDITANLSDLNVNLDKLIADMANAGDRIDATWKPLHEELHVDLNQNDARKAPQAQREDIHQDFPQEPVRYAPKPSKSCGICVVS